ncbi:MAG: LytTR family transcriptional regulator [Chitinophagaceae bacterium]|nr:LytTR family transcriptional regulator [Chitinophagaceae bacterium]
MKLLEKINNIHSKSERSLAGLLQQLQDNIAAKKIGIVVTEGVEFVKPEDIIKIEARGSYCIVYLKLNKKITSTKGMKEIEDVLPVNTFLRVHNTWIINTQHLKNILKAEMDF